VGSAHPTFLVFQLINADRDTGSSVKIQNLTDTIHTDISAGTLRPETPQRVTLGTAIDLTSSSRRVGRCPQTILYGAITSDWGSINDANIR
jgi:hypothetical protein